MWQAAELAEESLLLWEGELEIKEKCCVYFSCHLFFQGSLGGRDGNPLQYSCLENSMDRGAWWATVHGVERVRHNYSNQHYSFLTYFCKRIEESFYSIPTIPAPWDSTGSTSLTVHTLASFDGEFGWLGPCAFLLLWTLSMGVFQKHKGKTGLTSARMSQWEKRHSSYNCDHTQDTTLRRILFAKAGKTFPGGTQEKRKKLARD